MQGLEASFFKKSNRLLAKSRFLRNTSAMFGQKYLLLELDPQDAEYYHLPELVPYPQKEQKRLDSEGFKWDLAIKSMQALTHKEDCAEYKLYKLFIKKWPLYQKLDEATKEKDWKQAEKIIDRILSIDLLDPSAYLNLGYVFRSQKQFYKAKQAYQKGQDLVENDAPFIAGLARTYEKMGKLEDAVYAWYSISQDQAKLFDNYIKEANQKLIKLKVYKRNLKGDLVADENYELLMRKAFQKSFNDAEQLTKLGVKLVHHQLTKLAVKVFERVYELSQVKAAVS